MKKLMVYGLSVMFIAGGVASCKKSSKGKMANDWKVSNWEQTTTSTNSDGDVDVDKMTSDGSTITMTNTSTPSGGSATTTTSSGTVNKMTYTIAKDGTWSQEMDVTFTTEFTGGSSVVNVKQTISGAWDFLGGVGEFKKNERVVFNTTKESSTQTQTITIGGTPSTTTSTSSSTYADGENSQIFVVVESKKKELQLKSETNASWTDANGTDKEVGSTSMTLMQVD